MRAVLLLAAALAQDAATLNDRAQQLAAHQRAEEAAQLWREALKKSPTYFPAAFNLGFFHYSRREFREALPYLETAAKLKPTDFNTRFLSGQAKSALGRSDEALRDWRAALAIQPNHTRLMTVMIVEFNKGGYFRDAATLAKRTLSLSPDDINVHFLAIKACQDAQDPEGPRLAEQTVEKLPNSARANFEHAWYLQRAGKSSESVTYLRKAMAADPSYEEPHYFYGGILLDEGKLEESIEPLQTAVRLRPDYTSASVALGRALMELNRNQQALEVLQQAAEKSPKHPQPHLMLSRLYFRLGDESKAKESKETSLRLRRENAALMEVPQSRPFR